MNRLQNTFLLLMGFQFSGCAHHYFYAPEIKGQAVKYERGSGVIYSIPVKIPRVKMNLMSLGVVKTKLGNSATSEGPALLMRAYFVRTTDDVPCIPILINPSEFELSFQKYQLTPTLKTQIELSCEKSQAIEFLYPLPPTISTNQDLESFFIDWKVYLKLEKIVAHQKARFNLEDSSSQPQISPGAFMDADATPYSRSQKLQFFWQPYEIQRAK